MPRKNLEQRQNDAVKILTELQIALRQQLALAIHDKDEGKFDSALAIIEDALKDSGTEVQRAYDVSHRKHAPDTFNYEKFDTALGLVNKTRQSLLVLKTAVSEAKAAAVAAAARVAAVVGVVASPPTADGEVRITATGGALVEAAFTDELVSAVTAAVKAEEAAVQQPTILAGTTTAAVATATEVLDAEEEAGAAADTTDSDEEKANTAARLATAARWQTAATKLKALHAIMNGAPRTAPAGAAAHHTHDEEALRHAEELEIARRAELEALRRAEELEAARRAALDATRLAAGQTAKPTLAATDGADSGGDSEEEVEDFLGDADVLVARAPGLPIDSDDDEVVITFPDRSAAHTQRTTPTWQKAAALAADKAAKTVVSDGTGQQTASPSGSVDYDADAEGEGEGEGVAHASNHMARLQATLGSAAEAVRQAAGRSRATLGTAFTTHRGKTSAAEPNDKPVNEKEETAYLEAVLKLKQLDMKGYPQLEQHVRQLFDQVFLLKTQGKEDITVLTKVLNATYDRLTYDPNSGDDNDMDEENYAALAHEVQGHPSKGLKILAGIMFALAAVLCVVGIAVAPPVGAAAALGLTTAGCGVAGLGFFAKSMAHGLSGAMFKLDTAQTQREELMASSEDRASPSSPM